MVKKILIVDDSALMRRVISDIINLDDRFHVSKVATNGLEALDLLTQGKEEYDAIILDINMPKMNGIEFLEQLEKKNIKAIVIIVSTVAKEGAKETIRALELGAFDFVTKPESFFEVKSDNFRNKIIECLSVATKMYQYSFNEIKGIEKPKLDRRQFEKPNIEKPGLSKSKLVEPLEQSNSSDLDKQSITESTRLTAPIKSNKSIQRVSNQKKIIVIACSTGGPKALQRVIPILSDNLDCSILVVQHMPEGFTFSLAHRLNELSNLTVKEVENGETLKNGVVYIAKGGSQLRVNNLNDGNLQLVVTPEPARNGLKPCADILFESLIETGLTEITCVVLTGMGSDGTYGIKQLKENKNIYVIGQDEASCTVYGMPKVVAEAGLVNEVVSLDKVADAIYKKMGVR